MSDHHNQCETMTDEIERLREYEKIINEGAHNLADRLEIERLRRELDAKNEALAGMVAACSDTGILRRELAEARGLLREALGPVEHTANGALELLHTEVAEDLFSLHSRISTFLARPDSGDNSNGR